MIAVTPLNEKTVLLLRMRDGQEIFASEAGVENEARRPGPAFARFDPRRALVFDEASGARVEGRGWTDAVCGSHASAFFPLPINVTVREKA